MRTLKTLKIILGLLATTAAAGCAVSNDIDRDVRATSISAQSFLDKARNPVAADLSPIKVTNDVYVGSRSVLNENGDPLPAKFEKVNGIVNISPTPMSLRDIAAFITEKTKIPVVLAAAAPAGATASSGSSTGSASTSAAATPATPGIASGPVPAGFPLDQALAQISGNSQQTQQNTGSNLISATTSSVTAEAMPMKYSGSLSGLLDILSAHFNVAWKYERGRITIDSTVTRSFDVPALATSTGMNFKLGATSGNGGTASNQSNTDFFSELQTGLTALVGGGSFSVNKVAGVVTVTANPATVDRVNKYLNGINERMSQQVTLDVRVYSVTLRDSENLNFNLSGVLTEATKYGLNLSGNGTAPAFTGGGSLGWALLNDNKYAGSKATLQALAERGDVSEVTSAVVQTLNGQPVPFQVGVDRDYIPKIERQTDDNGNVTVSNETAEISSGFGLQLTPRVERSGDILLQYGIDISQLVGSDDGFDTREIGDNTVQLKRVAKRNFLQSARIPHQNTLILAGFEQTKSTTSKSGIGHPSFSLLGGGHSVSKEKEVLIIMITPTVIAKN
jgi:type IVB pilus formation R64 PilN family outer membrane protein